MKRTKRHCMLQLVESAIDACYGSGKSLKHCNLEYERCLQIVQDSLNCISHLEFQVNDKGNLQIVFLMSRIYPMSMSSERLKDNAHTNIALVTLVLGLFHEE